MKKLLAFCFLVFAPALFSSLQAQFEGQIDYHIYYPLDEQAEQNSLNLTITKERLFISSDNSLNVMAGIQTSGVLVRKDLNDFVLMTGEKEAVKITKSDLEGILNLINRFQGKPEDTRKKPFNWDERVVETGNTKMIKGYETKEFILKGDQDDEYVSFWLTDRIKVKWGLLQEVWYEIGSNQVDAEIPVELVMNNQSFPLLVDVMRGGQSVYRASATNVAQDQFDRSKVELAPDVKLLGYADLMMNMFRQQRR